MEPTLAPTTPPGLIYSHADVLTFDGSAGNAVDLSTQLSCVQGDNPRTIMFMVKITVPVQSGILIQTGTHSNNQMFRINLDSTGRIGISAANNAASFGVGGSTWVSSSGGEWHAVKVTYASNVVKLYIDGVLKATGAFSNTGYSGRLNTSGNHNWLGKSFKDGVSSNFFHGQMKEIAFFDSVV